MTDEPHTATALSNRDMALLRAVIAGRVEMTHSCEPDLFIDGLASCDQPAARNLVHAGLVEPALPAVVGSLTRARLTRLGTSILAARAMPA